jgi:uncharacterized protein YjbJ (UPF0337 family)
VKNKVIGKATELKGKATGNKRDELKGKAQKLVGDMEQTVKSLAYDAEHRKRS